MKKHNINNKKFVTTQSIKRLKSHLKDEALDLIKGWKLSDSNKTYNISKLRTDEKLIETLREMDMKLENNDSYISNYIRIDLTDDLHGKFGFRADFEVSSKKI